MVKAIIQLPEHEDRVLNVVKGKYGFKNKSEAMIFVIDQFEELLEPELRPEYVEKIQQIEQQGKFTTYKNILELRRKIEHA